MGKLKDLILKVVRGERPLADLRAAGVTLRFRDIDEEGKSREIVVKPHHDPALVVAPTAVDLAKGLLCYQDRPQDLKNWGSFVLGADLIDLEPLESDPQGDFFLDGVWDASFEGHLSERAVQAAERLVAERDSE
jgi:hypothetical protein